jgi:micrococcal nuclease
VARYHDRVFTIVKVVDGDTVDVDVPDGRHRSTRIRLRGVDTPEVAEAPTGEMYWGDQASRFARITLDGRSVRLDLIEGDTRDKYGRLLAYVYLGESGEMFNEMLLRRGHAYADTRFEHPLRDRFVELESEARAAGVGLWRDVTVNQMPGWRQRREHRRY